MPANSALPCDSLQLWFAQVSDATVAAEQRVQTLFSTSEKDRLEHIKNNAKRREYLLSRALMRHALDRQFQPQVDWQFVEQTGSPPLISQLPADCCLSLSHSAGLICFAISNSVVGVDIETINLSRKFAELAEVFMNADEFAVLLQSEPAEAEYFYRVWCAKEAFFKTLPSTVQADTSLREISFSDLAADSEEWQLLEGKMQHCRLAAVIKKKPREINCNHYLATNEYPDYLGGFEVA